LLPIVIVNLARSFEKGVNGCRFSVRIIRHCLVDGVMGIGQPCELVRNCVTEDCQLNEENRKEVKDKQHLDEKTRNFVLVASWSDFKAFPGIAESAELFRGKIDVIASRFRVRTDNCPWQTEFEVGIEDQRATDLS
jgi:hypothetical protein